MSYIVRMRSSHGLSSASSFLSLLAAFALVACSSVDSDGVGGESASGGGGSASTSTGPQGGGGGGGPTPCEIACAIPECATPDCLLYCEAGREGCPAESDALVTCNTPNLGSECAAPSDVCVAEREAYQACIVQQGPTLCSSVGFGSSPNTCNGYGPCINGQSATIECAEQNGVTTCSCAVDEVELGSCEAVDLSCKLEKSCCAQFF